MKRDDLVHFDTHGEAEVSLQVKCPDCAGMLFFDGHPFVFDKHGYRVHSALKCDPCGKMWRLQLLLIHAQPEG